jgi:hypothetical protein
LKKWLCFAILTMLLVLAGCDAGNDQTAYDLRNDRTNPNLMSHEPENKSQRQVEEDITGQNPNFLNLRRVGTDDDDEDQSNVNNRGRDIDIARDIINRSNEFTADSIWISNTGDDMIVTVNRKAKIANNREENHAIGRLQKRLTTALPRYSFDIRER